MTRRSSPQTGMEDQQYLAPTSRRCRPSARYGCAASRTTTARSGRVVKRNAYIESSDADGDGEADPDVESPQGGGRARRSRRQAMDDDDDDDERPRLSRLKKRRDSLLSADDEQDESAGRRYNTRHGSKTQSQPGRDGLSKGSKAPHITQAEEERPKWAKSGADRASRANARNRQKGSEENDFQPPTSSPGSV